MAYKVDDDGEYVMFPVTDCEFGCASGGMCGSEKTCTTAKIVGWICLGIFGCCFCACLCFFVIAFCKAAAGFKRTKDVDYRRM